MNNSAAKWIWVNNENNENTWVNFVRDIELKHAPESAVLDISVDSKYWLYINGELAIFEGGIKRGPSKDAIYFEKRDITKFLKTGTNRLALLVWYFGKDGFSHLSSGKGGLLLELNIDGEHIVSDDSWKAIKNPAYVEADENDPKANFRLSESNVYFDAALDIGDWQRTDFDISFWKNADIVGGAGDLPWGELVQSFIPQIKDLGILEFVNGADYKGVILEKDTVLKMKVPYNCQLTPCLEITAPAGLRIDIKAENYDDDLYDTKSVMAVYYTKEGRQKYESLGWLNGETIIYSIPKGVTIHNLSYRETGYNTEFVGDFKCDDEFLNKLWRKCLRTLYITMRDNFMDCPDRERAQWWGDVTVEMQMMMYCLDENALLLYKKGIETMAGTAKEKGRLMTVVPSGKDQFELPFQNLAGIWGFWEYYKYTGDASVPELIYEASKRYVLDYEMAENGLVKHREGSWDWPDWGDNFDISPMENAWYYMALQACVNMAVLVGQSDDLDEFYNRRKSIQDNYNKEFWKGSSYYNDTNNKEADDRANALAVLSGLAEEDKYPFILEVLKTKENSSPYMEKYVLDALCEMGYIDEAIERIKKRYKEMVDYDYATLWEYWNKDGTLNHAWSGGPLITLSKYVAGVRPLSPGYDRLEVKPHLGKLKMVHCKVPTVKGIVEVDVARDGGRIILSTAAPENIQINEYV